MTKTLDYYIREWRNIAYGRRVSNQFFEAAAFYKCADDLRDVAVTIARREKALMLMLGEWLNDDCSTCRFRISRRKDKPFYIYDWHREFFFARDPKAEMRPFPTFRAAFDAMMEQPEVIAWLDGTVVE